MLGIWAFFSPWIYGYVFSSGRFINSLCVGVIVFVLSIVAATMGHKTLVSPATHASTIRDSLTNLVQRRLSVSGAESVMSQAPSSQKTQASCFLFRSIPPATYLLLLSPVLRILIIVFSRSRACRRARRGRHYLKSDLCAILLGKHIIRLVVARTSSFNTVAMIETRRARPSPKRC